ncbi:MAG: MFS transporter [Proteobacteria bacterium]|nr:MFS transporter [Pseudomonadota bacterium]
MPKHKIISSTIVGNIVEYYDFGIYAAFTATIGRIFFPSDTALHQMMLAFLVFAVGFMMRPFGGIIFGHIGDKIGRKKALTISIIGMALSTFAISILPSYESVGVLAPILLIIIRLIQGICIGGEGAGSAIFILEHLEGYKTGLIGSIVMASNMIGTLLAMLVGLVIVNFTDDDFSWRYGFMLGSIMGFVGLHLRRKLAETPVFQEMQLKEKHADIPALQVVKKELASVLLILFLAAAATSTAYTIRAYLAIFFSQFLLFSQTESLLLTISCLLVFILLLPCFGMIADSVGYKKFLNITCIAIIMLIYPTFYLLVNGGENLIFIFIGITVLGALAAAISAPAYPYAVQIFSPEFRYSGLALSWNLGNAFFGGTTPTISTWLAQKINPIAPSYYLLFTSLLFLIAHHITCKYIHKK